MSTVDSFLDGAEGNKKVELARTTISLPADLLRKVEDKAIANKRNKKLDISVSAIVKRALTAFMD